MKLVWIEPTPSPNSMKINIDETLPTGKKFTYTKEHRDRAPEPIRSILGIPDVTSVFHTADFLAVDRKPNGDWKAILEQTAEFLGGDKSAAVWSEQGDGDSFGEAQVYVQFFRNIPLQVRVQSAGNEARLAMPSRISDAVMKVVQASPTMLKERKLVHKGVRYGDLQEIAEQMIQELDAAYDDKRLGQLIERAQQQQAEDALELPLLSREEIALQFQSDNWRERYAAFQQLRPTEVDLPLLAEAIHDDHASIRRQAVVYLGEIGGKDVLPFLYEGLRDTSVQVRRTAGDTINDIGDTDAIPAMIESLRDASKIVRWRAARFLYELGDESALNALKEAEDDPEFEVSLQVKMAIERIVSGEEAAGSVWQQMTRSREQK